MPKPKGSLGATKMKIMALMNHHCNHDKECYGYDIWQCLQNHFHIFINESDIRNVYHHLTDLCSLGFIEKLEDEMNTNKTLYRITEQGIDIQERYMPYLNLLRQELN
jgi:DNA-binding PadR family transcriptional regulator